MISGSVCAVTRTEMECVCVCLCVCLCVCVSVCRKDKVGTGAEWRDWLQLLLRVQFRSSVQLGGGE